MTAVIIILVIVAYAAFHSRHYRRHRRAGLTIRESIPGPFGTYLSIGKRFRQ
jgi:hypothetical protein